MALILSIETSAVACSVALHDRGSLIKSLEISEGQAHASKLAILIEDLLLQAGLNKSNLNAVAVSGGPGSYTGLRIGVSTAKGLCFGLGIPLLSVPTMLSLAWGAAHHAGMTSDYYCVLVDAKRLEVYCEIFDARMNIVRSIEAMEHFTTESISDYLDRGKVSLVGDGVTKYMGTISHPNAVLSESIYPKAEYLGDLAFRSFEAGKIEDLVAYTPFYLKDFVAKKAKSFF